MTESVEAKPLALMASIPDDAERITGSFTLRIGATDIPVEVTVPSGATTIRALLPVFEGLCNDLVARGEADAQAAGRTISCGAGCGACCRQQVPIAPSEARRIAAMVAAMPAPRRSAVATRFAQARAALTAAGVELQPTAYSAAVNGGLAESGMRYFLAGVPCPFLEAESCSIHLDRPLACREYLVTSSPTECTFPQLDRVEPVAIGASVARAVLASEAVMEGSGRLALVDALEWAAANPEPAPQHNGPSLVRAVIDVLAKLG
jgi:Fe-S-cluster containining protein